MAGPGDLGRELAVAILAARRAAGEILARRAGPRITIKPDGSPVTEADLAADAVIRATVAEAWPRDAILSEEGADARSRLAARRCWIVDPLDGTRQFIAGSDDFDTFVALVIDEAPVVAVTLQPATGRLVAAVAGRGAWQQDGEGPRCRLALSVETPCRLATKAWLGAPGNVPALEAVARAVGGRLLQPTFSLCPRCFVPPTPRVDAIVGLPAGAPLGAWEWDVAPLDLIVREAGGAATDLAGGRLRFNQPEPRFVRGLVVAADPALQRRLVAALRGAAAAGARSRP